MSLNTLKSTSKDYVEALRIAANELILRAEEIIGDIEGQQSIIVTINFKPDEIVTIDVYKTFISGFKQRIVYDEGKELLWVNKSNGVIVAEKANEKIQYIVIKEVNYARHFTIWLLGRWKNYKN